MVLAQDETEVFVIVCRIRQIMREHHFSLNEVGFDDLAHSLIDGRDGVARVQLLRVHQPFLDQFL